MQPWVMTKFSKFETMRYVPLDRQNPHLTFKTLLKYWNTWASYKYTLKNCRSDFYGKALFKRKAYKRFLHCTVVVSTRGLVWHQLKVMYSYGESPALVAACAVRMQYLLHFHCC